MTCRVDFRLLMGVALPQTNRLPAFFRRLAPRRPTEIAPQPWDILQPFINIVHQRRRLDLAGKLATTVQGLQPFDYKVDIFPPTLRDKLQISFC